MPRWRTLPWIHDGKYTDEDFEWTDHVVASLGTTVKIPARLEHVTPDQIPGHLDPRFAVFRRYMRQELGWFGVGMVTCQLVNDVIDWWNGRRKRGAAST